MEMASIVRVWQIAPVIAIFSEEILIPTQRPSIKVMQEF